MGFKYPPPIHRVMPQSQLSQFLESEKPAKVVWAEKKRGFVANFDRDEVLEVVERVPLDPYDLYFEATGDYRSWGEFAADAQNLWLQLPVHYYTDVNVNYPYRLLTINAFLKARNLPRGHHYSFSGKIVFR